MLRALALTFFVVSLGQAAHADDQMRRAGCKGTFALFSGSFLTPATQILDFDLNPLADVVEGRPLGIGTSVNTPTGQPLTELTEGVITEDCGSITARRSNVFPRLGQSPFNVIVFSDPGVYEVDLSGNIFFNAAQSVTIRMLALDETTSDFLQLPNASSVPADTVLGDRENGRFSVHGFINVREGERLVVFLQAFVVPDRTRPQGSQVNVIIEAPNGTIKRIGDLPRELRDAIRRQSSNALN